MAFIGDARAKCLLLLYIATFLTLAKSSYNLQVYKENCVELNDSDANIQHLYDFSVSAMLGNNVSVDIQPKSLDCKNILQVTTTVCQMLLKNEIATKLFHVRCDTGKYLRSLFRTLDVNHEVMELEAGCLNTARKQKGSIRSRVIQATQFIVDLMKRWGWKKLIIFADINVSNLLKQLSRNYVSAAIVQASKAESFLKVDHENHYYGAHFFVLCNPRNTKYVLSVANKLDLLDRPQTWILMSDISLEDLLGDYVIPFDAYMAIATTLSFTPTVDQRSEVLLLTNGTQKPTKCLDSAAISSSTNVADVADKSSSVITIDLLEIYSVAQGVLQSNKFGKWRYFESPYSSLSTRLELYTPFPNMIRKLYGVTLRLVVLHVPPYVILKNPNNPGQNDLSGFYGEIFSALAIEMGFNFTITVAPDGLYGARDEKGNWNGIIKELVENKADIALCDLSLTNDRKDAVDFSPVLSSGSLRIMYKKPDEKYHYRLYFIPFGWEIWALVLACIFISGLLLHVTNRWSPNSARQTAVEDDKLQKVKDDFSVLGCLLAIYNGFVQQGSDLDPHETSGKIVFVTVYLSFVIIFSSYTSIFTSFLTIQDNKLLFDTLDELYADPTYKIGISKATSQYKLFESDNDARSITNKVWKRMIDDQANFVGNIQEGIDRANVSKYAFLTPKETTTYHLKNNCGFDFSNEEIYKDTYHMAFRKNLPYAETFNEYIERMVEGGLIQRMNQHYQKDKIQFCEGGDSVQSLGFKRVVSLFLLLAGASLFAAAVLGVEWIFRSSRPTSGHKISNQVISVKNSPPDSKPMSTIGVQQHRSPFIARQYYYS